MQRAKGGAIRSNRSLKRFEECRNKEPAAIAALLVYANERAHQAMHEEDPRYWFWRCRALEIAWVANVISNILVAHAMLPIATMTARGEAEGGRDPGGGRSQAMMPDTHNAANAKSETQVAEIVARCSNVYTRFNLSPPMQLRSAAEGWIGLTPDEIVADSSIAPTRASPVLRLWRRRYALSDGLQCDAQGA